MGRVSGPDPWDRLLEKVEEWTWNGMVVLFYLPVANGAIAYLWWTGGEYAMRVRTLGTRPERDVPLGVAVGLLLVVATRLAAAGLPPLRRMAAALGESLGRPSWPTAALIALASAVGEELLFRGVIQDRLGLFPALLAFAAAHVPWARELWPWPLTALVAGLVFGTLYDATGAVLAPAVAHFVVNLLSLRWAATLSASTTTGSAS